MQATFLSVYTPTYKRPKLLERCKASVAAQYLNCQHVIVEDEVGLGVGGMYRDIQNHVHEIHADYVLVLSDDNCLYDEDVAGDLWTFAEENDWPDVVIWRGKINNVIYPTPVCWQKRPVECHIDLSCFVVRSDHWVANADDWPDSYEGDYHFIAKQFDRGLRFTWFDRLSYYAMQVSKGAPE
jgi:hypothetical protein